MGLTGVWVWVWRVEMVSQEGLSQEAGEPDL